MPFCFKIKIQVKATWKKTFIHGECCKNEKKTQAGWYAVDWDKIIQTKCKEIKWKHS